MDNQSDCVQDIIKKMRTIDDRIVQALNTTIPTDSFAGQVDAKRQCKQLYEEMLQAHQSREKAIKKCVAEVSTTVDKLREQKDKDSDNLSLNTSLRQEQYKLRAIRAELNVEEIIRDRSAKVFYERCRLHYTPDS